MANVEIERSPNGAAGRSSTSILNEDIWTVLMEEFPRTKKEETIYQRGRMFFRVPKPLLDSSEHFYIPDSVSIGPNHFGKPNLRLKSHKHEAVHRMERRIQSKYPHRTVQSIVEGEIMVMEKWIRDCYEEEIPYTSEELAYMVTSDACFIYEFILSYYRNVAEFMDVEEQRIAGARYDSIFDSCGMNPMWKRILFYLLLFENQIPLLVLKLLVEIAMGSREALQQMFYKNWLTTLFGSVAIFSWFVEPPSRRRQNPHLLGIFYHAMVGFTDLYNLDNQVEDVLKLYHFKDLLIPKLPSAKKLKEKGVKFACIPPINDCPPMTRIQFDEETTTLWLPQIHVDLLRIALIRNVIALEVTNNKYAPYPMTSFAMLMSELVDSAEDCRLLSEARINVSMLENDEEVAKAFNSIVHSMQLRLRNCNSIDKVRAGLCKYVNEKCPQKTLRILWGEFYSTHLSKPWQVVALIAATLLLLFTALQVSCLFFTCNR